MEYVTAIGNAVVTNAPYLVGFALPPFIEILNKDIKEESKRYAVALIICILVSVLLHWKDIEDGSPEKIVVFTGLIFMECQTIFKLYFAKSWMRGTIQEKIGTSPQRESINPEAKEAIGESKVN